MDRADLKELHYIAPIANLASIAEHGILSYRRTHALKHTSVAMQEVQDIRAKKTVREDGLYMNTRTSTSTVATQCCMCALDRSARSWCYASARTCSTLLRCCH